MTDSKSNGWKWLFVITATILVTRSTTFLQPLIDDEEAFAAFARVLLQGGVPYVSVIDNKPPILYYIYAACLWLFGGTSTIGIHLLGIACVGGISWYLYKIGQRIFDTIAGYLAALSFAVFSSCYIPPTIAVHASLIISLPITISVWHLVRWYDTGHPRWMVSCGALCGVAIFIKYQALMQLPFVAWALIYLHFSGLTKNWRQIIVGMIAYVFGITCIVVPILLWINSLGALSPMLEHTLRASISYMKEGESTGDFWARATIMASTYIVATLPLWVGLVSQAHRRAHHYLNAVPMIQQLPTWIWGWFFFTVPVIVAGGRFYGHYFIQLLPPLCLIASAAFSRWWSTSNQNRFVLSASLVFLAAGWMAPRLWYQDWADHFHLQNLKIEIRIADYLKTHMAPSDSLLIWGTEPGLYFLSERKPATRFLWSDALTGRLPGITETQTGGSDTTQYVSPKSWQLFWKDINAHPPEYIVDCASGNLRNYAKFPITHYPKLQHYIMKYYAAETTIDGVTLYRRLPHPQH